MATKKSLRGADPELVAQAERETVRVLKLRMPDWQLDPCRACGHWCVSNLDLPLPMHPTCYGSPDRLAEERRVAKRAKKAVNPDQTVMIL